jgi:Tfp pilus assembly protein PilV
MRVLRKKARTSNRRGVAVLEIMVGMVVLSIGLLGVGGMTALASRKASGLSMQGTRDGILLQELNKLASLPYDSLATRAGCATTTSSTMTYMRCVSVTDVAGGIGYKRVMLVISPATTYARPDTLYVNRAKGTTVNPLGQ